MAQTMTLGHKTRRATSAPRAGGVVSTVKTYIAMQGAAVRTADASFGHHQPAENDLRTLGIEHTKAYSAIVRH